MNDKQRRSNERAQGVVVYMDTPNEDFPEESKGAVLTARLRELQSRAAALQSAGITEGVDTNAALEQTLREMDKVVEQLDAIVRNKYHDDPAKLAAWESASRIERAPRSKPKDAGNAPPPANG